MKGVARRGLRSQSASVNTEWGSGHAENCAVEWRAAVVVRCKKRRKKLVVVQLVVVLFVVQL